MVFGNTNFQPHLISEGLGARVPGSEVALLMLKAWVEQDAREGSLL